jgi:hypothetical protein
VTVEQATDVLWLYSSAELFELLVLRQRWSVPRYSAFIAEAMIAALLAPEGRARHPTSKEARAETD